ncbi:hypothetical protein JOM56_003799 [Amanita muscaria]
MEMYAGTLFGDNKHEAPRSAEHRELWNRECLRRGKAERSMRGKADWRTGAGNGSTGNSCRVRESGAREARESGVEILRECAQSYEAGSMEKCVGISESERGLTALQKLVRLK